MERPLLLIKDAKQDHSPADGDISPRIAAYLSRRRTGSLKQASARSESFNDDSSKQIIEVPPQHLEVEGLKTVLEVVKKEIASIQIQTQKLSSNIVSARKELFHLTSQISESRRDSDSTPSGSGPPSTRSRRNSESIFSSCSTTRTSSTDSAASTKRLLGKPVVEQTTEAAFQRRDESAKQGWLWKTPITSTSKQLKGGWTKRWFVLKGFTLSYYRIKESSLSPEKDARVKGPRRCFELSAGSCIIRRPSINDLAKKMKDIKKFLPNGDVQVDGESSFLDSFIFVHFPEGKFCLRAVNAAEAAAWLSLCSGRLAQAPYVEKAKRSNVEPVERVLKVLAHPEIDNWDFKQCSDTQSLLIGLTTLLEIHLNVKFLSLAKCKLADEDILRLQGPFASSFPKISLQRLDLSENMIRAKGASSLILGICECSSLRELILDHNQLSDRGLEALARNIWGCGRPIAVGLEMLSVVDNNITDKGVQGFGEILAKVTQPIGLRTLQLGENNISDQGTTILRLSKTLPNLVVDLQGDLQKLETFPRNTRRALFK